MLMKLVRECKKADEEKKDGASHKRPLVEGIAKKAAVAALALGMSVMVSSCTASWGLESKTVETAMPLLMHRMGTWITMLTEMVMLGQISMRMLVLMVLM